MNSIPKQSIRWKFMFKNFFEFHIFSFFLVFNHDFSKSLILPMSYYQTQQLMMSQNRSHMEYLTQTNSILLLILYSKLWWQFKTVEELKRAIVTEWQKLSQRFNDIVSMNGVDVLKLLSRMAADTSSIATWLDEPHIILILSRDKFSQ